MPHPGEVATLDSGKVEFTLSYMVSEEKLIIKVNEVRDIQLSNGFTLVSPYLKVRIFRKPKQFFTFRESVSGDKTISNLEKELKTRMKRPTDVLSYKETFEVPTDPESLKSLTVNMLLCDMDKFARHVILGEISVPLRKAGLLTVQERTYLEDFAQPDKVARIALHCL